MSRFSSPNRRPTDSRILRSADMRRSTAITAASRPEPTRRSMMWLGCRNATIGPDFVMVESTREIGDKIERETRFYITSLVWLASHLGPAIRSHWAVENSLHWVMDMVFPDCECAVLTDNAPANFTTIKHIALNLIRKAPGKDSFRLKRKVAAWDDEFLASILAA